MSKRIISFLYEFIDIISEEAASKVISKIKSGELNVQLEDNSKENSYKELIENETELLTRDAFIKGLNISSTTLTKYIKEGVIKPIKVGRKHLFTDQDYHYLENIKSLESELLKNTKKNKS